MDVWRINLSSGAATLEIENPGDVAWWIADDELVVRAGCGYTPQGGFEVRVRSDASCPWRTLVRTSPDEEAMPLGFSKDGRELFLKSSVASDPTCVITIGLASSGEREIARMDGFDAEDVMIHPVRRVIEAVAFAPGRARWQVVDPAIAADFEAIAKLEYGDFRVASRDLADLNWVVAFTTPHRPVRYFLWDRAKKQSTFLFSHRPELDAFELAEVHLIKYRARDGLEVHGYLTLPPGVEPRNLPLVLHPHGGPWSRDYWIFNVWTQLLANRGYAVLQPNYRGSTGSQWIDDYVESMTRFPKGQHDDDVDSTSQPLNYLRRRQHGVMEYIERELAKEHDKNLCANVKCTAGEDGKRKKLGYNMEIVQTGPLRFCSRFCASQGSLH